MLVLILLGAQYHQLRILVILGNSEGINLDKDREALEKLISPEVYIEFLDEPKRTEISDSLWQQNWDMLFFSGHSSSEGGQGRIFINRTDSLTIDELKYGLRKAIRHGLQLAVFNSCDGLGLAEDLADLNLPQVIFMREPIIDQVAQSFLKIFLERFSQGESLYLSVRHTREQLIENDYDEKFPGSCWLPVIFQNPTVVPPDWKKLKGFPKPSNPYRALFSFREEDSEYFFGRENFVTKLQNIVEKQNFAMVLGASGSGKSSLVNAGLVPKLREQWTIVQFRPWDNPFYQLASALAPFIYPKELKTVDKKFVEELAKNLYEGKKDLFEIIKSIDVNSNLLLIVDQFEELYTSNSTEVQNRFIGQLLQVVNADSQSNTYENLPQFTLLITLRVDFYGKVLANALFNEILNDYSEIKLGPMAETDLKDAIEKPAKKQGVEIETGLTDRILQDLGAAPGNLSLLEFALDKLWDSMSDGVIGHKDYEAIGGVEKAIGQYADDFYNVESREQTNLRRIMVQLVRPGEGTDDVRQVATRSQVGEDNWRLAVRLAGERLVVIGQNEDKQDTVELVHEALIRHWPLLRKWMNEDRDILRKKHKIETAAREWKVCRYTKVF
ncbi:CHAT domain-containing protein [Candidatus Halobeggiatoa sp. HSG11]|nr:CHAT domain-containing protein [Candidatus Halobeggiatoa sp. HSG11]